MSNQLCPKLAAIAIKLTKKYGMIVKYSQYPAGGGEYDPSSGQNSTTGAVIPIDRLALVTDQAGNRINPKDGQILDSGTLVQGGDKWVYFLTDAPRPSLQDHCIIEGINYAIKGVQVYGPGGIDVLYLCVLRQ